MSTDTYIAAMNARGIDNSDLQHCIHEACHALRLGVEEPWSNDAVHEACMALTPVDALADEVMARAVESLVMEMLGEKYDIKAQCFISLLEFMRHWSVAFSLSEWVDAVRKCRTLGEAELLANTILDMLMAPQ